MNPLDAIEKKVAVAVETVVQEGIAKVALSRLIVLHPDNPKYSTSLKPLEE